MDDLVLGLRASYEQAFEEFRVRFAADFYYYFKRRGLPDAEAMDLAENCLQDIPLKVRDKFPSDHPNFDAWVRRLRNNAAHDWWRRRERLTFEPLDPDHAAEPSEDFIERPAAIATSEALERLSEFDRQILVRRFGGRSQPSFGEIAADLTIVRGEEIKEATVRKRHERALAKLYRALQADPRLADVVSHRDEGVMAPER